MLKTSAFNPAALVEWGDSTSTEESHRWPATVCNKKHTRGYSVATAATASSAFPEQYSFADAASTPGCYWYAPSSWSAPSLLAEGVVESILEACRAKGESSLQDADEAVKKVLLCVYHLDEKGYSRSAAQEVMCFVEAKLKRNSLLEANRLLEDADFGRLSSRSLIGMIRSTSRLRDKLPAWWAAYIDSRKQICALGKNADALFIGLPAVSEENGSKDAK